MPRIVFHCFENKALIFFPIEQFITDVFTENTAFIQVYNI